MVGSLPPLPTVGAIADRCGVPAERVSQKIRRLGIKPVARAGSVRVFSLEAAERIRREFVAEDKGGAS